jgi:hypothetical protein
MKMCLREIGWEVVDWLHLFQIKDLWRPLAKRVINLQIP